MSIPKLKSRSAGTQGISVFWFRRDLRLEDNAALYYALRENAEVLPVFIFDRNILDRLEDDSDRRVDFIHQALERLNESLTNLGSSLRVFDDVPENVFRALLSEFNITRVYANHDYEPYARERDQHIAQLLKEKNCEFKTFKDQCIFEKSEIVKGDGTPYTVFTPYSIKWKQSLSPFYYRAYPTKKYFSSFIKVPAAELISLKTLGFKKTDIRYRRPEISEDVLRNYTAMRNFPSAEGTSRLSVHLRFGTVSVRSLVAKALPLSETWLNELIWRDFFMMILWHFPHSGTSAFKKEYNFIPWRNEPPEFLRWCRGETGFPIVDAGMRELNATGFMHNRVRMITSSFLVKDLLIDWRWGEAYFAAKLNDFDRSANNGGWQWAAGSGCDAAPYFRVFNPHEQQKKFDPDFTYIKKWIPEFGTPLYSPPIVDHAKARIRALEAYNRALSEEKRIKAL